MAVLSSPRVRVLRIGHRLVRDQRINTHMVLVARAFGASELFFTGKDEELEETVKKVGSAWGGEFTVEYVPDWRVFIRKWKKETNGLVVHLTMYGEGLDDKIEDEIRRSPDVLLVVGSQKVPAEIFRISDRNVAVGHQPHSEVAALAVFLDRLFKGEELHRSFERATLRVVPSKRRKVVQRI